MRNACRLLAAMGLVVVSSLAGAETTWPFWDHYAAHFLDSQGRIVDPDRDGRTTSEAQSYALFFSLVANDPNSFARVLRWTTENLGAGDLAKNLPAWSWGHKQDGSWGVIDGNSAADADLWTAYSLIEAGELWNRPDYGKTGRALLSLIASEEVSVVPHAGRVLMPGRAGFHPAEDTWFLNPSYLPLPLLLAADHFGGGDPWRQMAANLPVWLMQTSPAGFASDWVMCDRNGCAPSAPPNGGVAEGSYDAIRVYLWSGMTDPRTPGVDKIVEALEGAFQYVRLHGEPPEVVRPDGEIVRTQAPVSFSAVFLPYFQTAGDHKTVLRLQRNVLAEFAPETGLLGTPPQYYDQNLALFALGWQQQRFRFASDGTLRVSWKR
ncbi:MAG TPA: cellulose synthase complex periplasmic endoglucanase BcsZ [Acidobacteriaceae bacterium]|nr:cellulose synthase complex periplasmic endoglucanase BcsZ [Acidobacteriaceae bacterium]